MRWKFNKTGSRPCFDKEKTFDEEEMFGEDSPDIDRVLVTAMLNPCYIVMVSSLSGPRYSHVKFLLHCCGFVVIGSSLQPC